MDLKKTVDLMLSEDYKERFIAEYLQTKIRHAKLADLLIKVEDGDIDFNCSQQLLEAQLDIMQIYIDILENRAMREKITLPEVTV